MIPTVGRIVHYYSMGRPFAAVITDVHGADCVDLFVMAPYEEKRLHFVNISETPLEGAWSWPKREGA